jgi:hypothetical protein
MELGESLLSHGLRRGSVYLRSISRSERSTCLVMYVYERDLRSGKCRPFRSDVPALVSVATCGRCALIGCVAAYSLADRVLI